MVKFEQFKEFIATQKGTIEESLKFDEYSDLLSDRTNWNEIIKELLKHSDKWVDGNTLKTKNILTHIFRIVGVDFIIEYIKIRNTGIESFDEIGGYLDFFRQELSPNEWNMFPRSVKMKLIEWTLNLGINKKNPIKELIERIHYDIREGRIKDIELPKSLISEPINYTYDIKPSVYFFRSMIKEAKDDYFLEMYDDLLSKYK